MNFGKNILVNSNDDWNYLIRTALEAERKRTIVFRGMSGIVNYYMIPG